MPLFAGTTLGRLDELDGRPARRCCSRSCCCSALNGLLVGILNAYDHFTIPALCAAGVEPRDHRLPRRARADVRGRRPALRATRSASLGRHGRAAAHGAAGAAAARLPLRAARRPARPAAQAGPAAHAAGDDRPRAHQLQPAHQLDARVRRVATSAPRAIDAAFRIYMLPQGMFSVAIATVLFPALSRFVSARRPRRAARRCSPPACARCSCCSSPRAAITLVLAEPITRLIYQRGEFGAASTDELVATALFWFSFSLPFSGRQPAAHADVLQPPAALDRRRAVAAINLVVNVAVSVALYGPFGIAGHRDRHRACPRRDDARCRRACCAASCTAASRRARTLVASRGCSSPRRRSARRLRGRGGRSTTSSAARCPRRSSRSGWALAVRAGASTRALVLALRMPRGRSAIVGAARAPRRRSADERMHHVRRRRPRSRSAIEEELLLVDRRATGARRTPGTEVLERLPDGPRHGEHRVGAARVRGRRSSTPIVQRPSRRECGGARASCAPAIVADGRRRRSDAALQPRASARGDAGHHARSRATGASAALLGDAAATPVAGMHVHVGMPDPETAIRAYNGLRRHLPLAAGARGANSPVPRRPRRRRRSLAATCSRCAPWVRTGVPRALRDYDELAGAMSERPRPRRRRCPDYTFFWWKIRPHPRLGTVEVAHDATRRPASTTRRRSPARARARQPEARGAEPRSPRRPEELLDEAMLPRGALRRGRLAARRRRASCAPVGAVLTEALVARRAARARAGLRGRAGRSPARRRRRRRRPPARRARRATAMPGLVDWLVAPAPTRRGSALS